MTGMLIIIIDCIIFLHLKNQCFCLQPVSYRKLVWVFPFPEKSPMSLKKWNGDCKSIPGRWHGQCLQLWRVWLRVLGGNRGRRRWRSDPSVEVVWPKGRAEISPWRLRTWRERWTPLCTVGKRPPEIKNTGNERSLMYQQAYHFSWETLLCSVVLLFQLY